MIASLAMYDFGDCMPANDRFWVLIRDRLRAAGIAAPEGLTRGEAAFWPAWHSADLVLSQTCGLPYRARLHGQVTLIGTPDYGLEGCPPGYYRSLFVVRSADPRDRLAEFAGARLAYNEDLSQSGWAAPQNHALERGLTLGPVLRTGAHRQSAAAIDGGRADIAALDALTWQLMLRNDPALTARLRVIAATDPKPGLPYISAPGADQPLFFAAIAGAIADLDASDRAILSLKSLVTIPAAAYLAVPNPPDPALFVQAN
jgi:ABC-type phosphate/phosphonate transport system substrate-binding protein